MMKQKELGPARVRVTLHASNEKQQQMNVPSSDALKGVYRGVKSSSVNVLCVICCCWVLPVTTAVSRWVLTVTGLEAVAKQA